MSHAPKQEQGLLSLGMLSVLAAQFLSALADNAILIAAIAIIKTQGQEGLTPVLQAAFVIPFILFAPFVGHLADVFPKGQVMLAGNLLKFSGALMMTLGLNPFIAYGLIGLGAALYSPAKYGILSQMFGPENLVRANGLMEASTIAAILLGVLAGGWLADHSLHWVFWSVLGAYGIAAAINLLIPYLAPEKARSGFQPSFLLSQFKIALSTLFHNPDARFSLIGTSIFWGSGTTLRLILFAWVPAALLINDNQTPANLMGCVSIGIVAGAAIAGIWISLRNVNQALWGGVLLGPAILVLAWITDLTTAMIAMGVIGLCGGLFIVPLNALLQERGHATVGAGNALAVQNFFENFAMLGLVGIYYALNKAGLEIQTIVICFGTSLFLLLGWLAISRVRKAP